MAASADAAPSYWDTIVHAPSGVDTNGDMIIEELPTGSVILFVLTTLISWFFQLPGFILTYLLHATHAGRFGSQAGLALTLIQWGFGSTVMGSFPPPDEPPSNEPGGPPPIEFSGGGRPEDGMMNNSTMMDGPPGFGDMQMPYSGHEWISFFLMTVGAPLFPLVSARRFVVGINSSRVIYMTLTGWFLLLTSLIGYFRVKRFELSVRASRTTPPSALSPDDIERNVMLRRNLEDVWGGVRVVFDSEMAASVAAASPAPQHGSDRTQRSGMVFRAIEEARLQNDLRNAGLL